MLTPVNTPHECWWPKTNQRNKNCPLKLAAWNIRTLLNSRTTATSDRPSRCTTLVAVEPNQYEVDIAALSETHLPDEDLLTEVSEGYTFFWRGLPKEGQIIHGVGFAIKTTLMAKLPDFFFSARLLQDKCREQKQNLFLAFVDLAKAFDTVNRETLWTVLSKFGCPQVHEDHESIWGHACLLSDPFELTVRVKQGCVLEPVIFNICTLLTHNELDSDNGIAFHYRCDGSGLKSSNANQEQSCFWYAICRWCCIPSTTIKLHVIQPKHHQPKLQQGRVWSQQDWGVATTS